MAAFNKFPVWLDYVYKGKVNLSTDAVKVMLTNTAPPAGAAKYADISANELAAGNGYTTGGAATPNNALANSNGTETFGCGNVVFTSSSGSMGPFRYAVLYDATPGDQPLIGYWDYGSSVTLNGAAGETFTVQVANPLLSMS